MYLRFFIKVGFFLILITLGFYLHLSISNNCKTLKIFKSIKDFGISHLDTCHSNENVIFEGKKLLSKTPLFYEIARKIRRTYFTSHFKLDNPPTNEQIEFVNNEFDISKNLEKPFVLGMINSNQVNDATPKNIFEFENWNRSHGDQINSKFNPDKTINKVNIKNLKLKWKYSAISNKKLNRKYKQNIESNPIFIDKKIISITADWKIIANDAIDGSLVWELQSLHMPGRRGMVAYTDDKKNNYIFIPLGNKIYKINANDGNLSKNFGNQGWVKGFTLVAPLIYKNNLIVVSTNSILIFNLETGKELGSFSLNSKNKNFERGAIWGGVALDKKNGIVFANTGNPQPAIYGVHRPGGNEFSCSVIAFDLNKKKIIWSFQDVSHDLWDFDIPSPPILHNLRIKDKIFETVISVTKTGNTLILDRKSGKPIFNINYRKAPKSKLLGDFSSPYQIFLKKPERFFKIEYSESSFNQLSKEKIIEIKKKIKNANYGWFETPSLNQDLIMFGLHGGAQWMGASLDPINQYLYIPVNKVPWKIRPYVQSREIKTFFKKHLKVNYNLYLTKCSSCHGKTRNGVVEKFKEKEIKNIPSLVGYYSIPGMENKMSSLKKLNSYHNNLDLKEYELNKLKNLFKVWDEKINSKNEIKIEGNGMAWSQFLTSDGLPASNPPWGYIAKLNLVTGDVNWKSPYGDLKIDGNYKKIGTTNFGGLSLNGSDILFFTGTEDSKAYAIDANNGEELWSYTMDAAGSTPPTIFTYNGNQYVTFLSTGGNYHNYKEKSSTLYTFGVDN